MALFEPQLNIRPRPQPPQYSPMDVAKAVIANQQAHEQNAYANATLKEQNRNALFQQFSQLPQNIFNAVQQFRQYQQQQAMNPLEIQKAQADIASTQALAGERQAKIARLSKIVDTAKKEPNVFVEAMKNLRANLAFMTTTDQDTRQSMIENEIDMVKGANQRSKGVPIANPTPQAKTQGMTKNGLKFTIRPK